MPVLTQVGLPTEPRSYHSVCNLTAFRPAKKLSLNGTFEACHLECARYDWCVSLQHEWWEYSCPEIAGLGMGYEGRCYDSACVLLSTDLARMIFIFCIEEPSFCIEES